MRDMGVAQNLGHGGEQHLLGLIQQETRFLNIGRGAVAHQLLLVGRLLRTITGMPAVRSVRFQVLQHLRPSILGS